MDYLEFMKTDYYRNLPYGELLREDEEILHKYAFGEMMEIGTFLGRSACLFASKASSIYTVDLFEKILEIEDEKNKVHYSNLFGKHCQTFERILNNLTGYKNINVIQRTPSLFMEWLYQGRSFDRIFFDGDHSYKGVKDDFYETLPLLKDNGLVMFHDSVKNEKAPHHEVYLFLEEIKDRFIKIDEKGSVTVWKRK